MARRRWIKLWTQETLAGTTFRELEPAERFVWFGFLALAGDSLVPGTICAGVNVPFSDEQLARVLAIPKPLLVRATKKMADAGKISLNGGLIHITNWNHYQPDYARVEAFRQRQNVTPSEETPGNVTPLPDQTRPDETR